MVIYTILIPHSFAQAFFAARMYTGSLSLRITTGLLRQEIIYLSFLNTLRGQREIYLQTNCLAVEVIIHIEQSKCPAIGKQVSHEIYWQDLINTLRHRQDFWLSLLSSTYWACACIDSRTRWCETLCRQHEQKCLAPWMPSWPFPLCEMVSPFFWGLRNYLSLELFPKIHLLQATVFFFKLFHARYQGDFHSIILNHHLKNYYTLICREYLEHQKYIQLS